MDQIDAEAHAERLETTLTNGGANAFWRELANMLTTRTDNGKNACAEPLPINLYVRDDNSRLGEPLSAGEQVIDYAARHMGGQ